jgi:hypothetical protein
MTWLLGSISMRPPLQAWRKSEWGGGGGDAVEGVGVGVCVCGEGGGGSG